jgi:hypothetical protein
MPAPREDGEKFVNSTWWHFVRGLGVPNPGTLPEIVAFLHAQADPDALITTNFGADTLYFYSNLRQSFRIAPEAPVRAAALEMGLPDYVFDLGHVDWIVWRPGSDLRPGVFARVRADFDARGARLETVASFREVLHENRPELQWHRFPRVGYPFASRRSGAGGHEFPNAVVYRVTWP